MSRFVRTSKFRHVYGDPYRRECVYDNIKVTRNAWDSNFCAVNEKFVAVVVECSGGGQFLVLCHDEKGKCDPAHGKVVGHKGHVLDLDWNPFNPNMIASASEDCSVMLWIIPDEGVKSDITEPSLTLSGHTRKVGQIRFHPSAENILFSSSTDLTVCIWNISTGTEIRTISCWTDNIYCMSLSLDGSKLITTSKDKKLRLIDTHTGKIIKEVDGHQGSKSSHCVYLTDCDHFVTTGFSRSSDRQYILWDKNLNQLKVEDIDTSSGVLMPYYDSDLKILYLAGKGDGNIRYYEITNEGSSIFPLSEYKSAEPQRGFGCLPKRACDTSKCEIARFYKLHSKNYVEPIPFIVPRKSDLFQDDIYPPCAGAVPALTAEEWISGKDAPPKLISLADGYVPPVVKQFVAPVVEKKVVNYEIVVPKNAREYEEAYHYLLKLVRSLREESKSDL